MVSKVELTAVWTAHIEKVRALESAQLATASSRVSASALEHLLDSVHRVLKGSDRTRAAFGLNARCQ
jgi:hypothetical protein